MDDRSEFLIVARRDSIHDGWPKLTPGSIASVAHRAAIIELASSGIGYLG